MKRLTTLLFAATCGLAGAHDNWIEPSATAVRPGDWLSLSLMLGNHGNKHRDFKIASKVAAGDQNLTIVESTGHKTDLTAALVDRGSTEEEGFWQAKFAPTRPGAYMAVNTLDKVMSYGPVRDIKCAKAFFIATTNLDRPGVRGANFTKPYGAAFEMIPLTDPASLRKGETMKVRVLMNGKPIAGVRVGFVPRGANPQGDMDPNFERATDADGTASMTLKEANCYLVAAHLHDDQAKGEGYTSISYSATICVLVKGK